MLFRSNVKQARDVALFYAHLPPPNWIESAKETPKMFLLCTEANCRRQVCVELGDIARPLDIPNQWFDSDAHSLRDGRVHIFGVG